MDNSPFVKLPAELRVQIWEHVLSVPWPRDNIVRHGKSGFEFRWDDPHYLAGICRQFRDEFLSVYWRSHVLEIYRPNLEDWYSGDEDDSNGSGPQLLGTDLLRWLDHVGEDYLRCLSAVKIHLGDLELDEHRHMELLYGAVTKGLVHIIKLFQGSRTQVTLHFNVALRRGIGCFHAPAHAPLPLLNLHLADQIVKEHMNDITWFLPPARDQSSSELRDNWKQSVTNCQRTLEKFIECLQADLVKH